MDCNAGWLAIQIVIASTAARCNEAFASHAFPLPGLVRIGLGKTTIQFRHQRSGVLTDDFMASRKFVLP
jgi:hypothetical protein